MRMNKSLIAAALLTLTLHYSCNFSLIFEEKAEIVNILKQKYFSFNQKMLDISFVASYDSATASDHN